MKKAGYAVLFISTGIILLDALTPLKISGHSVYNGFVFLAATSLVFIKLQGGQRKSQRTIISMALIIASVCIMLRAVDFGDNWTTQTIMYQNSDFPSGTVEYQMIDEGAFGSSRRIIERYKILPFIDWIQKVEPDVYKTYVDWINDIGPYNSDSSTWKRVNIDVNELGQKSP